jgi:hypothetical protein
MVFEKIAWFTAVLVTAIMAVIAIVQPDAALRAVRNIVIIDGLVLGALWLAGRGRVRAASWIYVWGCVLLITLNAISAGGIRSPGIPAFLIFVMMAGLLLGEREGGAMAVACAVLGLGLIAAERWGLMPAQASDYTALVR